MMFSLVAPLLLLLLSALLMRLFAVIADENIFNLLYAIEREGAEWCLFFVDTTRRVGTCLAWRCQVATSKQRSHMCEYVWVCVWRVGVAARNKTVCVMNLLLNCVAYDNNYNSSRSSNSDNNNKDNNNNSNNSNNDNIANENKHQQLRRRRQLQRLGVAACVAVPVKYQSKADAAAAVAAVHSEIYEGS